MVRAPINGILSHAVDSEIIETNPLKDLKIVGRKSSIIIEPLTEAEATALLKAAQNYLGGAYYPLLLCALRTGMRVGELQALKWKDLDYKNRLMEVRRSYRRGKLTTPKNKKRRRVDMTPLLEETLRKLHTEQKKNALKKGQPVPEWVFANKKGNIFDREAFKNALERCLQSANLRRIRIHDLRHSYATIRLLRGHNVGDVSYQLGHSSIKMTYDVYVHWIPGRFKSELDDTELNATHTQPNTGGA